MHHFVQWFKGEFEKLSIFAETVNLYFSRFNIH